MSVDKKLLHLRSNQANNYPTGDKTLSGTPIMDYGEIAINYAHDNEFMSIRNSDNKLVLFKPWTFIEQILKDNELVTASALTQIKNSCGFNDYGEYISSSSTHFISEAKSITEALNTLDSQIQLDYDVLTESINELTESVEGSNKVTAAALTRLKESCGFDENGNFNPNIEILNGVESLGSAIEVIANDTQARLKNIQATFDGYAKASSFNELKHNVEILEQNHIESELVTATALTQLKNSCGFNDYGEYHPNSNTIISGCSNITEAIDVLANTANNTSDSLNTRNLLLNTNQGTRGWGFSNNNVGTWGLSTVKEDGINCLRFKYDDNSEVTNSTWEVFQYQLRPELIESGKTYTFSFDIKQIRNASNEVGLRWQFGVMNPNTNEDSILYPLTPHTYNVTQLNTWEHISITFTPTKSGTQDGVQVIYLGVHYSLRGLWSEFLIKNLQLVEGEDCYNWNPAPEDIAKIIVDNDVKAYVPDVYYGEYYKPSDGYVQTHTNNSKLRTNKFITLGQFTSKFKWKSNPGGTITVHSWDSQGNYNGCLSTGITANTLEYSWNLVSSGDDAYYAFDYQSTNYGVSLLEGDLKINIVYEYAKKSEVNALNEQIEDIENNIAVCSYVKGGDATYTFDNSLYNVSNNNLTRIIYAVTGLKSGEQITVSFDYEISGIDFSAADSRISIQNHENWGYTGFNFIKTENGSGHHVHTMTVPTNLTITEDTVTTPYILLKYINGNANSVIKISNFKIVKGDKEYKNTVSLPDLNYRIGYNKVTALNGLVATKRMVYCEASASHTYYPHSYDLMPNGEEMHILVKNVHASSNITISFSTNHIRLSGDSITIKPGEYAEINVLRIDQNYYIRAI